VEFVKVIIHDFSIFPLIFPYMWSFPFSARVSQYITHDNIYYHVKSVIQTYHRQFLKWHHITEPDIISLNQTLYHWTRHYITEPDIISLNQTLYRWTRHYITEPSLINILSLISYARNDGLLIASLISGFTFHAILLWEIHSSKTNLFKL
jgi:hypothetical protein